MMSILPRYAMSLSLCVAVSGCVNDPPTPATSSVALGASPYVQGDLGTLTYRAVDLMLAAAPELTADSRVVVASVSDTQKVESTSAFGNIISDMIRTRVSQAGHLVSEIRLRNAVSFKKGEGEFLLSRDQRALMPPQAANAIVTGTSAPSYDRVYVSIKLLSAADSHIISGADFVIPLRDVQGLLNQHTL
jgi:TolB-like protein